MLSVSIRVNNIEHEIAFENLMQSFWVKWSISLVQETGNAILFGFWVNIVSLLLKPFAVGFGFFEIELASIDNFIQINI
jgi:hypothetical protein